jgi:hypothetical protein
MRTEHRTMWRLALALISVSIAFIAVGAALMLMG